MRLITMILAVVPSVVCSVALAGQKSVTCYLDGARVEQEVAAKAGYLEYPLPDAMTPGSLRVKPLGGSVVRVELLAAELDPRRARQLARLEERKGESQDRLQALKRREEIFSAAAKSQSGKGLRKTKSNPDPAASLKEGTDLALVQLDGVYRSQRKARNALEALERELAAVKGGRLAKIWLSGGRAKVSYRVASLRWTPCYDFRWSGGSQGELLLHARLPQREKGVRYLVANGNLSQAMAANPAGEEFPVLCRYPLTLLSAAGDQPPLSFAFAAVEAGLPPGEAALFWRGEYLGSAPFAGGGATEVSLGR